MSDKPSNSGQYDLQTLEKELARLEQMKQKKLAEQQQPKPSPTDNLNVAPAGFAEPTQTQEKAAPTLTNEELQAALQALKALTPTQAVPAQPQTPQQTQPVTQVQAQVQVPQTQVVPQVQPATVEIPSSAFEQTTSVQEEQKAAQQQKERERLMRELAQQAELDELRAQLAQQQKDAQKKMAAETDNIQYDHPQSQPQEEYQIPKQGLFDKINALFAPSDAMSDESGWQEPKDCAQDDLGWELLREDGIMRIEQGLYAMCLVFEDVNYQGALYDTQLEIHSHMNELYNGLPDNCAIQLFMHTRKMHDEELASTLHIPLVEVDDGYNELREEQNKIVDFKMATTAQNVKRTHCFVITCEELTMDAAKRALMRAISGIERKLRDIESSHKVLDGQEWLTLINHITNPNDEEGLLSYEDLVAMPGATTRDLVAPPNITTYGMRGFSMGNFFYRVLYVNKYSNSIRDDFFSQLAEMPYNSVVSMHAKPYDQPDAIDLVTAKRTDLTMQKKQYIKKNPSAAYQDEELLPGNLGEQLVNARETRNDLIHREQSMFDQSIIIMLYADSLEELGNAYATVERIVKGFQYRVAPLNDMQILGLQSALPIGNNNVPMTRGVLTDALSNFSPFTADELLQPNGIFGGINQLSKNAIAYDRTSFSAPNGFLLGKPGRGKSVTAKSQIVQILCRDPEAKCLVIDPEGEYGSLCKLLPDAQHIKITANGSTHLNPLDITDTYSDDADPLSFKTDFIMSLVDMMTQGMTQPQLNILDRCARLIYQTYFNTHRPEDMPTLQTLYDEIRRQAEPDAQILATNIERFVEGSMNIFNTHTNVRLDARLVVFDTKELQKNLSPVALLILLDQVWNFVTSGRAAGKHTWFFVDEMQLLAGNKYAITYLDELFSRARKWGAIPTGITQNVERVLAIEQFRYMIANSDFLVLLGQSETDTDALADVLKLSPEQKKAVRSSGIGEGLIIADGKILQFENQIPKTINGKPSKIYQALTTKLEDLVEMGLV